MRKYCNPTLFISLAIILLGVASVIVAEAQGASYGERFTAEDIPLHADNDNPRGIEFGEWDGVHYMFVYDHRDKMVYTYQTDTGTYNHARSFPIVSSRQAFSGTNNSSPTRTLGPCSVQDINNADPLDPGKTSTYRNQGYARSDDGVYEGFAYGGGGLFYFVDSANDSGDRTTGSRAYYQSECTGAGIHYPSVLVEYRPAVGDGVTSGNNGRASVQRNDDYDDTLPNNPTDNHTHYNAPENRNRTAGSNCANVPDVTTGVPNTCVLRVKDIPLAETGRGRSWEAYGATRISDSVSEILIRYTRTVSGDEHYYWGIWSIPISSDIATTASLGDSSEYEIEAAQTVTEGGISTTSTDLRFAVDADNDRILIYDDSIINPTDGDMDNHGMASYNYTELVTRGRLVRDRNRDIRTINTAESNVAPTPGGAGFRSDGDNRIMYAIHSNSTYASGVAANAYQASGAPDDPDDDQVDVTSGRTAGVGYQYPPTITAEIARDNPRGFDSLEPNNKRALLGLSQSDNIPDDPPDKNIRVQWGHTSNVTSGGNPMMIYEWWSSNNPNIIHTNDKRTDDAIVPDIDHMDINRRQGIFRSDGVGEWDPKDQENGIVVPGGSNIVTFRLRYKWTGSSGVIVKNPPNVGNACLNPEDPDDPSMNTNTDLSTPGCAFDLGNVPDNRAYSGWTTISINVLTFASVTVGGVTTGTNPANTSAPSNIPGDAQITRGYWGIPSAIGDVLIVMGQEPAEAAKQGRTFSILIWLVFASVVAFGIYYGTGAQTGSMYLGGLLWLIIWTGLGPFVAGVPTPMAYMPAAVLLFGVALLIVKRGRL